MRKKLFSKLKIQWLILWIFISLFYLFPFIWIIQTAFRDPIGTYGWPPDFIFRPNLNAFIELFVKVKVFEYMKDSFILSILTVIFTLIVTAPAAYALSVGKFRKRRGLINGLLFLRAIPGIALIIPIFLVWSKLGITDTYYGIVVVYVAINVPFSVWLLRSFYIDIPETVREAAIIDGCSEIEAFLRVILPISKIGLFTSSIFVFIGTWSEFLIVFILSGRNIKTLTMVARTFKIQFGVLWGQLGAVTVLTSIPIIIFAMITQKYLVRGMTAGAVQ